VGGQRHAPVVKVKIKIFCSV
jgi:hypothetical protein